MKMDLQLENIGCAKDNMKSPIHNWYRFTAGFSYKFVDYVLKDLPKDTVIYEPFAGCGTTLVSSQKRGLFSVGNEGQKLMYDICRAKLDWTIRKDIVDYHISRIEDTVIKEFDSYDLSEENPLLIELYDNYNLKTLCIIRNYITSLDEESYKLFFKLALSNVLHKTSIHPIAVPYISRNKMLKDNGHPLEKFTTTCLKMINDIDCQPRDYHPSRVFLHDSRQTNNQIEDNSCSICITSPPYLNNLDYGEVSKVLSHFWGITNSWHDITSKVYTCFRLLSNLFLEAIKANAKNRSGKKSFHILMMHYFSDMYNVLLEMRRVLKPVSKSYLILGDSAPYGVYIPTTQILGDIAISAGFNEYAIYKIRTRGTKWKSLSNRHNIELSENILELN